MYYIQCAEDESEEPTELPLESDGTLAMSTLQAQYPGASGLKYRSPDSGGWRGLRVTDGKVYQADNDWSTHVYITVYPKDNKRRGDVEVDDSSAKTKRVDLFKRCTDLIVLGLPWKTTEEELKDFYEQFGEVALAQIKKDPETGRSRGYGFIRFKDYEVQQKVISQRHLIDGRWCDVRVPNSKGGDMNSEVSKKIFVGRVSEELTKADLKEYFSKFGEVTDVFIPKPHRGFAFVSFCDSYVAQQLQAEGEDHIIKSCSVKISNATAKTRDLPAGRGNPGNPGGAGFGGGFGNGFGQMNQRDGNGMGGGGSQMDMSNMMNPAMMQSMMQMMMMSGMMGGMSGGGGGSGNSGSQGAVGDKFGGGSKSGGFGGNDAKREGFGGNSAYGGGYGWSSDGKSSGPGGPYSGGYGGSGWHGSSGSTWN